MILRTAPWSETAHFEVRKDRAYALAEVCRVQLGDTMDLARFTIGLMDPISRNTLLLIPTA
jgi:hypothetical protein